MSQVKLPRPPAIWIDGVESNAKNPDTFLIPGLHERRGAKIGDFVKIGVESIEHGHEKFWVEVIARIDNGNYVGVWITTSPISGALIAMTRSCLNQDTSWQLSDHSEPKAPVRVVKQLQRVLP